MTHVTEQLLPFNSDAMILAVDTMHGIYSYQVFAQRFKRYSSFVSGEDWDILLKGPNNDEDMYLFAWDEVLDKCVVFMNGEQYSVFEDDGIWLIPSNMEWPNWD